MYETRTAYERRRETAEQRLKLGILIAVVLIVVMSYATIVLRYNNVIYPLDRASGYLTQASATNNFTVMQEFVQQAYAITSKYSGNPAAAWPWAKPATNYNYINTELSTLLVNMHVIMTSKTNTTQQYFTILSFQSAINGINGNLQSADSFLFGPPYIYILAISPIWCPLFGYILIVFDDLIIIRIIPDDSRNYNR